MGIIKPISARFLITTFFIVLIVGLLLTASINAPNYWESFSLNLLTEIIGAFIVIILIDRYLKNQIIEIKHELFAPNFFKEEFTKALDDGNKETLIEVMQSYSWYKWIRQNNVTGFMELRQHAIAGNLVNRVKESVLWELERIRRKAHDSGVLLASSEEERQLESHLKELIALESGVSNFDQIA